MAKPVLKWAGGKSQLLAELTLKVPITRGTYFEPFIGGGAPFFSFAEEGRFQRAVINDFNPELTNLYEVVRDRTGELIDTLIAYQLMPDWNTREFFEMVRASDPEDPVARAA